ncbi:MAG: metal ABC transporter ATP-binding protein [bacterium]|nr:metal ABC transporter ATP-binding protein [bacterium]
MSVDHSKNIIEIKNISFTYGQTPVLKDISFTIHEGDYLSIVGPNGSGKTTLLKVMLGLLQPSAGEIRMFGEPLSRFKAWSKLGYVPQKAIGFDPLFPATVYEVVAMGRYGRKGLWRRMNSHDHDLIKQSLSQVEMLEHKDRLIGELSGGQQQRVFIARALAGEPQVIFLDEPTVGVDVQTQEQFYALLKRLNQELGLTLILVSHDIDVVVSEVTELACINQTLIYHGEPKEFIQSDYLQKLYGKNTHMILHGH